MNKKYHIAISVVLFLVVAYLGLTNYASDVARARIDAAIAKQEGKVSYNKVAYDIFTQKTTVRGISILPTGATSPFYINEIVVHRIDIGSHNPTFLSMDMRGIRLDHTVLGDVGTAQFSKLGYALSFDLNVRLDYDYVLNKQEVKIQSNYDVKDVGSLRLRLLLGSIDPYSKSRPINNLASILSITIKEAELYYMDASLVGRIIKQEAASRGVDVSTVKEALGAQVETFLQKPQTPRLASVAASIKQFVDNPRQLTISINPEVPVSLGDILKTNSPETIASNLNLQVKL